MEGPQETDAGEKISPGVTLLSINKLSLLTGKTRESIGKKLAGVPYTLGGGDQRPGKFYDSKVALEVLYLGRRADGGDEEQPGRPVTIQEAARDLSIARKKEIDLKMEVLRKERIPIEVLSEINEGVFLNIAAMLKTHEGKTLTPELLNDIFAEGREIGRKVKEVANAG